MARKCFSCGKGPVSANKVSHSNIKTKRRQLPNLHSVKIMLRGAAKTVRLCTGCLKAGKFTKSAT